MIFPKTKDWPTVADKVTKKKQHKFKTDNPGAQKQPGSPYRVGILALQGGVREHLKSLSRLDFVRAEKVKYPKQLPELEALIIPGGESTTIGKLIHRNNFIKPLQQFNKKGKPIWGTCAGLILLARKVINRKSNRGDKNYNLGLLDITVKRNAYGSQLSSFITEQKITAISSQPIKLVFIRAPIITEVGRNINILARVKGNIVAAEKDNLLVTSFHPELTEDPALHQYFVNKILKH